MNSPPDPSSPSPSTPSSGSPPPEEAYAPSTPGPPSYLANLSSHIGSAFNGSSAPKRRLPTGSSYAAGSARDPKSRRRGESGRSGSGSTEWQGVLKDGVGKKEKDELIDTALVDYLRKEIGDPFLEPGFKG